MRMYKILNQQQNEQMKKKINQGNVNNVKEQQTAEQWRTPLMPALARQRQADL